MTDTEIHERPRESQALGYAAAIYGSIVATSIVGALRVTHAPPSESTTALAATLVVLWLLHTWAAVSGERIHAGHRLSLRRVKKLAREEWPIVEAGIGPVIALALGWAGVLDEDLATRLAIGIGIVQLFAWGFVLGRRVYNGWFGALVSGVANGALGVVLVALEIAVSH